MNANDSDSIRQRNIRRRRNRAYFNLFAIIFALFGISFGIYGTVLTRRVANENPEPATEHQTPQEHDPFENWSVFHDVDLFFDKYHPIDIACENAFMELETKSRIRLCETVSHFAGEWKNEMNNYLVLLDELIDVVYAESHSELQKYFTDESAWKLALFETSHIETKQALIDSQQRWETFVESNEWLHEGINNYFFYDGLIMQNIRVGLEYNRYRSRALELKDLCEMIEKDLRSF
ncbi:MAG: hypothetical protein FWE82_05515 [Defluviitaleaceae bacterium]|nr:hypothetical protein [Defluviitaleaceae bacterium]